MQILKRNKDFSFFVVPLTVDRWHFRRLCGIRAILRVFLKFRIRIFDFSQTQPLLFGKSASVCEKSKIHLGNLMKKTQTCCIFLTRLTQSKKAPLATYTSDSMKKARTVPCLVPTLCSSKRRMWNPADDAMGPVETPDCLPSDAGKAKSYVQDGVSESACQSCVILLTVLLCSAWD